MVKLKKMPNGSFALFFNPEDIAHIGLTENMELRVVTDNGDWSLVEVKLSDLDKVVITKLEKMAWKDRIEGRVENNLTMDEYKSMVHLLKLSEVVKFKGDEKFKNHVFLSRAEFSKTSRETEQVHTPGSAGNVFMVLKSRQAAQQFSERHKADFQAGELIGLKDFDGNYYVLSRNLYTDNYAKVLGDLKAGDKGEKSLSGNLGLDEIMLSCLLPIMKDKGLIYEKRKGIFSAID